MHSCPRRPGESAANANLEHAALDHNLLSLGCNTRERVQLRLEDCSRLRWIHRKLEFLAVPFDRDWEWVEGSLNIKYLKLSFCKFSWNALRGVQGSDCVEKEKSFGICSKSSCHLVAWPVDDQWMTNKKMQRIKCMTHKGMASAFCRHGLL